MKVLIITAILFVTGTSALAEELNVGAIIGSITGLSLKAGLGNNRAIDGALAWSSDSHYGTAIHADYLIENAREIKMPELSPLAFYYGIGARFWHIRTGADDGKTRAGVRVPFGLDYYISNPNLEFFGEIVPVLDVTPSSDVYVEAGLGLRFRF